MPGSDLRDSPMIVSSERASLEVSLQFAEMFPACFGALCVCGKSTRIDLKLACNESQHVWRRNFPNPEHATREPQISKMHGEPEAILIPSPLSN